jgi:hypothetical protein
MNFIANDASMASRMMMVGMAQVVHLLSNMAAWTVGCSCAVLALITPARAGIEGYSSAYHLRDEVETL